MSDATPGIRRHRAGRGFVYVSERGSVVRDRHTLARIRSLVIPPAWQNVWISARADGYLQAVGRDARGRKQYRYHPHWREWRERDKFSRLADFGETLPRIRRRIERDLGEPGLRREKVLATVVRLLESTLIRVGNEEYARQNGSFGLTTLRNRHVRVSGQRLRFRFRAKSGKTREIELSDARLARIVRRCRDLPGQELFQYVDGDGKARSIGSGDVNGYVREISGAEFTTKDFRTWAATVEAARALREIGIPKAKTWAKRNVVRAIDAVAERLGNTRAVCRKSYIHPVVIDRYVDGRVISGRTTATPAQLNANLSADERAVIQLLREAEGAPALRLAS